MRHGKTAPMILALLLLSGCGTGKGSSAEELALALRTRALAAESVTATVEVTADYGEEVFSYSLRFTGSAESGQLTLLEPEELAGTAVSWSSDGSVLSYEGVTLETGELSPDGLSPTDGIPLLLSSLTGGGIEGSYLDTVGEETLLAVEIANPDPDYSQESRVLLWADPEDLSLKQASVSWEGTEVLRFSFTEMQFDE